MSIHCWNLRQTSKIHLLAHISEPACYAYCGQPWPAAYINFMQNTHQIHVLTKPLSRAQAIFYSLPNNEWGNKYRGLTYSGAAGLSAVCDCGIYWSYSHTFFHISKRTYVIVIHIWSHWITMNSVIACLMTVMTNRFNASKGRHIVIKLPVLCVLSVLVFISYPE